MGATEKEPDRTTVVPSSEPFGPFILERRIAVGGSAEVFLARPTSGDKPAPELVIKRPLPDDEGAADFAHLNHEAQLLQAIHHPNVVKVYGAGMVRNEPYLALEYVEGVDLHRLARRAAADQRAFPPALAVYIARCIADALSAVHEAEDEHGTPLRIVHADVSPSNIYLSLDGEVKLGDFGIARQDAPEPQSRRTADSVKGKFGYLAPEQLAGEPVDHRADLFALGAVFGELLLGARVFSGSGQLAVLLSIRDADIEPLRAVRSQLPAGLFDICQKILAREPGDRYLTAAELSQALKVYEQPSPEVLQAALAEWVSWGRDSAKFAERLKARVRSSASLDLRAKLDSGIRARSRGMAPTCEDSRVRMTSGKVLENLGFAKLVEMIATGELCGEDHVSLMGASLRPISEIEELARHVLPSTTGTTGVLFAPGAPDFAAELNVSSMVEVLTRMRVQRETGGLFVVYDDRSGTRQRKELYLRGGRLTHVASSEKAELLGEYLVRRKILTRDQLELALTMLSRYGGKLGDTLVGLETLSAMQVFRALREQGRDRVADICTWSHGSIAFYRGTAPGHVQFPLDLDLAVTMMAGIVRRISSGLPVELPDDQLLLKPGPRFPSARDRRERGTAPASLQQIPSLARMHLSVATTRNELIEDGIAGRRRVSENEANSAIVIGHALGWVEF